MTEDISVDGTENRSTSEISQGEDGRPMLDFTGR